MSITLSVVLVCGIAPVCFSQPAEALESSSFGEQVFEVGGDTYTQYNYNAVDKYFEEYYNNVPAGCSATAKVTPDGKTIVGRNLDLTLSNRAVFVVKTQFENLFKTIGLCYSTDFSSNYNEVKKNGIKEDFKEKLPYMVEDCMNTEGLYAEVNMCYDEVDENTGKHFVCTGTNPLSDTRTCSLALPQILCSHCANIEQALAYAQTLDIYSLNTPLYSWCLNMLLADASGRYGVLQIAENKLTWLEGQQTLTNFFPEQDLYNRQKFKMGIGRYQHIQQNIGNINNETDMLQLMKEVTYSRLYDKNNLNKAPYEMYSEFVNSYKDWTYEYVVNNSSKVDSYWNDAVNTWASWSYATKKYYEMFWISIYRVAANCTDRSISVRFFEDDTHTYKITFDNPEKTVETLSL